MEIKFWKMFALVLLAMLAGGCGDGMVVVRDSEDVFTARLPEFDGDRHGDGFVEVQVAGSIYSRDRNRIPIKDAKLWVETSPRRMSYSFNKDVVVFSDSNGDFDFKIAVGAAFMIGGGNDGKIYQTSKARLVIEKEGFETATVLIDYGMPRMKILLKPEQSVRVRQ